MTTITFERNGGVTGDPIKFHIDLNSLPANESQALLQLVQNAEFFQFPEKTTSPSPARDEFEYTIIVEAGASARHVVHTSDTTAPESLRPLIDELSKLAHISPV